MAILQLPGRPSGPNCGRVAAVRPAFGRSQRAAGFFSLEQADASGAWFERRRTVKMPKGTVKKIVSDRGFGFIAAEDGKEYFFHQSGVDSPLNFDSLAG